MILDTTFLVDAQREANRAAPAGAHAFLRVHGRERFHITFTVAGELGCGRSTSCHADWMRILRPFEVLPWNLEVSWAYGEIYRELAGGGGLIGANDLWIAATARVHGMPLVTRDVDEFQRVDGLEVLGY